MKISNINKKLTFFLYLWSTLIIVFLFIVVMLSMKTITFQISATNIMEKLDNIPQYLPKESFIYSLVIICFLFLNQFLKYKIKNDFLISFFIILDVLFCFILQYFMYINYKGVFYILPLNILFFKKGKNRYWFLALFFLAYFIADLKTSLDDSALTSFKLYVSFFNKNHQIIIHIIKYILFTAADLIFIISIIFFLTKYVQENEEILNINKRIAQSNKELKLAYTQLKEYSEEAEKQAISKERARMAMEIHDTVGHGLTGIMMGLEACSELLKNNIKSNNENIINRITSIREIAKNALIDIRNSIDKLKPVISDRFSLYLSVTKLIENLNNTGDIKIKFTYKGDINSIIEDKAYNLYRVIQESLTNAIKNGKARQINIYLFITNHIELKIWDDGKGCNQILEGNGLRGIRERVNSIGGNVTFSSSLDKGFQIEVYLPYE